MKKILLYILLSSTSLSQLYAADSLYDFKWLDEGEKVFVIQNKEYVKSGRLGIDLSIIDSDSSPFQETGGFMATVTYYMTEDWSVDFTFKNYQNEDSGDLNNLLNQIGGGIKPIIRKVDSAKLIHINWIPFYGKINTFNRIFFFDWGIGIGFGQFETQGNWKTFDVTNIDITYEKDTDTGFNFRSFAKFYLSDNYTMGFEYNLSGVDTIKDPNGEKETLYFADIIFSAGYIF